MPRDSSIFPSRRSSVRRFSVARASDRVGMRAGSCSARFLSRERERERASEITHQRERASTIRHVERERERTPGAEREREREERERRERERDTEKRRKTRVPPKRRKSRAQRPGGPTCSKSSPRKSTARGRWRREQRRRFCDGRTSKRKGYRRHRIQTRIREFTSLSLQ